MEWVKEAMAKCQAALDAARETCRVSDREYQRAKEVAADNDKRVDDLQSLLTYLEQVDRNEPAVEVPL